MSPRSAKGSIRLAVAAAAIALLLAAAWGVRALLQSRQHHFEPPQIRLEGVAPQVAELVVRTREEVLRAPSSGSAWGKLGEVLLANAFYQQASESFAQAERLQPADPRWPYLHGRALQEEMPEGAAEEIRRAVALAPASVPAPKLTLAEILIRQGDLVEAETLVRQVLDRDATDARALLDLGRIENARGDSAGSAQALMRSIELAPQVKASRVLLASVEYRLGRRDDAQLMLREAADLPENASWPDPYAAELIPYRIGEKADLDRARNLLNSGQYEQLVPAAREMVGKYPGNSEAWEDLGVGLARQNQFTEAEAAFRNATRAAPQSLRAAVDLIVMLGLEQHYDEVEALCRKAIADHPDAGEPHYYLGAALARQGRWDPAIAELRAAVQLRPDVLNFRMGLSDALLKTGHPAEAAEQLRLVVKLAPENQTARKLLEQATAAQAAPTSRAARE